MKPYHLNLTDVSSLQLLFPEYSVTQYSSLRFNGQQQYLSAHSTELLGSGAHSPSAAYDVKDPRDWLRWTRKLVTRRGWWSNAFVGWTMVTGVVILGLVAGQWVLSSGFYTVRGEAGRRGRR
ncbi:hypothetical protein M427DRAFT_33678 [Gonapodya prolifera JEL478]|uniref:Uncharacterized protein n=1 Tax=Gonapodya prolifera (strain JEL478) TaxID=1344416 RepID=A0A139ABC2_GONPJ|nr:hypothetical protein M427DRAFT_33678 [Gonapodya prolifera JEL478]|eukprot:KXS13703.1 hypothetical protein M427DRAFT_33678 [Gonapodya prolifera JEL478]